jgi:hypothetical protein
MAYEKVRVQEDAISSGQTNEQKLHAQASATLELFKAGVSAAQTRERTRQQDQQLKIERGELKFVGGKGGLKLSSEWVGEVDDDPVPILPNSEFRRLTDLFTKAFFPDDSKIKTKSELLIDATDEYVRTNGKGICNCIYYGELIKVSISTSDGPREVVLQINSSGHLRTGPVEDPVLPRVALVLEPAEDTDLAGHIAYPGDHYPARVLVQELNGKRRGYLERIVDRNLTARVSSNLAPNPAQSVWYLDLYAQQRIRDIPRALVNGDRVAIYGFEKSSCHLLTHYITPGFSNTITTSNPFPAYRRDLIPRLGQYPWYIRQVNS